MDNLLKNLNKKQQEAVKHADGPSVILAGAGSGKTRVLIHKVLYLIQEHHVGPTSIVMITFTNKAATEMKERIATALSTKKAVLGYVGTFHSFCCKILRRDGVHIGLDHNFSIYDTDDQTDVIKSILKKYDNKKLTPSYISYRISAAKNMLVTPERYLDVFSDYNSAYVAEIYFQYQKELQKNQAVDFDDLIMKVTTLFTQHPQLLERYQQQYKYFLIDEFQDTNYAQYALTRLLGSKDKNVTAVGDFSQSIYSWRGADIRNLEKFKEDFPEAKYYNLEQNYRSTQKILDFAFEVINKNETHPVLQLFTENEEGEEIEFYEAGTEQDEAVYVVREIERLYGLDTPYNEFAVLYRTNAQSRVIEEAFLHYSIPYTLIGGIRFYERKEIKDILSYIRLFVNPNDQIASERIRKLGKRRWDNFRQFYQEHKDDYQNMATTELMDQIFAATGYLDLYNPEDEEDYSKLENIKELKSVGVRFPEVLDFLEQVALVESEYFEGEKAGKAGEGVRLMTLHQAKGLEFKYVFIVGLEEGLLPHSRATNDLFELEEERRLFYVGITRARKKLYITNARRRFIFGRRNESAKSRFISSEEEREQHYW